MSYGEIKEEMRGKKVKVSYPVTAGRVSDRNEILKYLEKDKEYTIEVYDEYGFNTDIILKEFPNKVFNSVMFDFI